MAQDRRFTTVAIVACEALPSAIDAARRLLNAIPPTGGHGHSWGEKKNFKGRGVVPGKQPKLDVYEHDTATIQGRIENRYSTSVSCECGLKASFAHIPHAQELMQGSLLAQLVLVLAFLTANVGACA
jgi:hypothetical protein